MRSFRLFSLILMISAFSSVSASLYASETVLSERAFFNVIYPFDEPGGASEPVLEQPSKAASAITLKKSEAAKQARLEAVILKGMKILLVRLTGQPAFLRSAAGQGYLKNPSAWLTSYDITPRMEEGVQVGQDIVMHFSEDKLRSEFKHRFVKIWPLSERPNTWVMGTLIQNGELLKLDDERLQYRVDIDFRARANQIALPITLAPASPNWILPSSSTQSASRIQGILASVEQDYLLSFKVVSKSRLHNLLTWNLFADSGVLISKGFIQGADKQALIAEMFDKTLYKYVQIANQTNRDISQLRLNIYQVANAQQADALERLVKQHQPTVLSASIASVGMGRLVLDITYQGEYAALLKWIRTWRDVEYLTDSKTRQTIDVKMAPLNRETAPTLNRSNRPQGAQ